MAAMVGRRMRGGLRVPSCLVITVLVIWQLHVMVGVAAARRMPSQLLHESCLKVLVSKDRLDVASLNEVKLLLNTMPLTLSADVMVTIRDVAEGHNNSLEHGVSDHRGPPVPSGSPPSQVQVNFEIPPSPAPSTFEGVPTPRPGPE